MTRTAIAAAMLAAAMGSAFAGTDHFVPQNVNRAAPANPPSATVDNSVTMSIGRRDTARHATPRKTTTQSEPAQEPPDLGLSIYSQ